MAQKSRFGITLVIVLVVVFVGFFVLALQVDRRSGIGGIGAGKGVVAVLPVEGVIVDARDTVEQLIAFREDDGVKAIVLRVDSPGGVVAPSQELHAEIRKTDAVKPVITSIGAVCASGGYYAAVGSRHIMANPGSIVGSIGVIMEFVDISELTEWAKIKPQVVKSGPYKDIGNPTRAIDQTERRILQDLVDSVYGQFVSAVAEGRGAAGMTTDSVRAVAQGQIYSGQQARDLGLVDELGTLQDAIAAAGELADLGPEPDVVYPEEKRESIFRLFMQDAGTLLQGAAHEAATPKLHYIWRP